ncbi:hypothetical protein WCLP8_5000002 [uncultured Gammaproteobacteria bacterium]
MPDDAIDRASRLMRTGRSLLKTVPNLKGVQWLVEDFVRWNGVAGDQAAIQGGYSQNTVRPQTKLFKKIDEIARQKGHQDVAIELAIAQQRTGDAELELLCDLALAGGADENRILGIVAKEREVVQFGSVDGGPPRFLSAEKNIAVTAGEADHAGKLFVVLRPTRVDELVQFFPRAMAQVKLAHRPDVGVGTVE